MSSPAVNPLESLLVKVEGLALEGRWREAGDLEARLIARASADPILWQGLAAIRLRLGQTRGAVEAARRACDLAPRDATARRLLARSLALNGRWAQAVEAALAAAPGSTAAPDALADLAGVLLEAGRPDLAEPLARESVAHAPARAARHRLLAACARQTGELDTAREHIAIALDLDPGDGEALWLRSDLGAASGAAARVDDLRRRTASAPSALAFFALGRELERLGDDAPAFDAVARGAALMRASFTYDGARDIALMDERRRLHTAAALPDRPGLRGAATKPIFVLGLPRTGTSLVERVLGAHSQVGSLGEPPAFDRAVLDLAAAGGAAYADAARLDVLGADPAALGEAYVEILGAPPGWVVDKRPLNVLHVAAIRAALPQARIVLVERDARDAGWAIFKTPFAPGAYPYSYDLTETGRYLAASERLHDHWRRTFGDDILSLRYEDLVSDFEPQARRLLAFCGLPWEDACLRFHDSPAAATSASAMQVRRPIYASSIGLWRRYEPQLRPMTAALAG